MNQALEQTVRRPDNKHSFPWLDPEPEIVIEGSSDRIYVYLSREDLDALADYTSCDSMEEGTLAEEPCIVIESTLSSMVDGLIDWNWGSDSEHYPETNRALVRWADLFEAAALRLREAEAKRKAEFP